MKSVFAIITFLSVSVVLALAIESPIVRPKIGPIRGKLIQLPEARQDVYEFTAIPFAEPPLGDLRFKKPVSKAPWTDVLDATEVTKGCIQVQSPGVDAFGPLFYPLVVPGISFSEDCLYLNIWAPRATVDAVASGQPYKPLSVIAVIHGGGFVTGMTMLQLYNGTMMSGLNNVIMITMHYRLGSLGFAYFGKNEDAPGNAGLWDMNEALKWISENIAAFGGNASSVTLAGESAGSAAVSYQLISPKSRKYFQQAIMESGTAIAPWAYHTPEAALAINDILLSRVSPGKCDPSVSNSSSIADKLKCLRSVDAQAIGIADGYIQSLGYANGPVPTVDGDFIPRHPAEMLLAGDFSQVPMIMGSNKDEGSMLFVGDLDARKILPNPSNPNVSLDALTYADYKRLVEIAFAISSIVPRPVDPVLFNAIQLMYWPKEAAGLPTGRGIQTAVSQALGDYSLGCPTYTWASVASGILQNTTKSPVFVYHFTQPPPHGILPEWVGPFHGEDLIYIYGLPFTPYAPAGYFSYEEKILTKTIMEYWGNFIKFGDPNIRDQYAFCDPKTSPPIGPHKCQLNNWPSYIGKECPFQMVDLSVTTQVYKNSNPLMCAFKARECLFWSEYFPSLLDLLGSKSAMAEKNLQTLE